VTAARAALGAIIALVALAACGAPPPHRPGTPTDDAPRTPYTVELSLTADPASAGRATLRVASRGGEPVTVMIPERVDQIEWFDPDAKRFAEPVPRVLWTAWLIDNVGLVDESRPSTAQAASKRVTLASGDARDAVVDLAGALDALFGPGAFARGWCARAWLVGGAHPVPSNIACWPAP
jgi:hypothetical protein